MMMVMMKKEKTAKRPHEAARRNNETKTRLGVKSQKTTKILFIILRLFRTIKLK
jgi:hypothetical protein